MEIREILWIEPFAEKNETRHHVTGEEAQEVFDSNPHIRFMELGNRDGEDAYAAFGRSDAGRYLVVYFIWKLNRDALVVSARDMDQTERRYYEKQA